MQRSEEWERLFFKAEAVQQGNTWENNNDVPWSWGSSLWFWYDSGPEGPNHSLPLCENGLTGTSPLARSSQTVLIWSTGTQTDLQCQSGVFQQEAHYVWSSPHLLCHRVQVRDVVHLERVMLGAGKPKEKKLTSYKCFIKKEITLLKVMKTVKWGQYFTGILSLSLVWDNVITTVEAPHRGKDVKQHPGILHYFWCIVVVSFWISPIMVSSEGRADKPAREKNQKFLKKSHRQTLQRIYSCAALLCCISPVIIVVAVVIQAAIQYKKQSYSSNLQHDATRKGSNSQAYCVDGCFSTPGSGIVSSQTQISNSKIQSVLYP